jgi:hypothetical protein
VTGNSVPFAIKGPLAFLAGAITATAVAAVSFAIVASTSLEKFPEIAYACAITQLNDHACLAGAYLAGALTLAAFALVLVSIVWAAHRPKLGVTEKIAVPQTVTMLLLAFCFALLLAHLIARGLIPANPSRIDELHYFSTFVSIENLLWPLLIQLLLLEKDTRLRSGLISALMLIMVLTPYRAVVFAIFVFGFALPIGYLLCDGYREKWSRTSLAAIATRTVLATAIGVVLFLDGAVDSQARALTASPIELVAPLVKRPPGEPIELTTIGRLRQRFAFPLYQAAIVEHLSRTQAVPSLLDELARKFRLNDHPNLNEFAYRAIYPGSVTVGQTTSLYYGEGAAYFGAAGILWTVCAPLLLVIAWFLLSRLGLEVGAIMGIALWRSSFAGLITILPAVLLQLFVIFVIARSRVIAWFTTPKTSHLATALLLMILPVAAVAQIWATVHEPARHNLLKLEFQPKDGCAFNMRTIQELPDSVDNAFSLPERRFESALSLASPNRIFLVLPYGQQLRSHLSELVVPVSHFTECKGVTPASSVIGGRVQTVSGIGIIPLYLATLLSIISTIYLVGAPAILQGGRLFKSKAAVTAPHATASGYTQSVRAAAFESDAKVSV